MPMFKKSLAVLLILVAATIGGTMYGYYSEQETLALDAGTNMPPEPPRSVTVYVSGEVKKPGLVILPEGKRVGDAVNEVGGVIETADIDRVNMAALLEDGMHIRVPENQKFGSKTAVPAGNDTDGRININTANEKELQELPGIGPAMSARIVEYREENGNFKKIEDIKKIRGIGNAKFEKLKDKVTI